MRLRGIEPGDIVLVDDGLPYHGLVRAVRAHSLEVAMIGRQGRVATVTAALVVEHWRKPRRRAAGGGSDAKRKRSAPRAPARG